MARSVSDIQQQMLDEIAADPVLSVALTSTSKRAIYRLFTFIIAAAIAALEQLIDIFTLNVETIAAAASPATPSWLQDQILKFQYSATDPQVIQYINFAPSYPIVDETLRIISRCSVTTTLAGQVQIKVATGDTPAALSAPQITALQAFILPPNGIGIAGVNYVVSSSDSDKLYIQGNVYYNGQYSNVIQEDVISAIDNFLATIPFNGQMKITDLEQTIRNVPGVNDVLLQNVIARANATAFGSGTYLIQTQQVISRLWNTVAGYIVGETTASNTLEDTLNFIAE